MSAFIVSRETISRAVSLFDASTTMTTEALGDLGTRLWRMNAEAVARRYDESIGPLPPYRYRRPKCAFTAAIKAAHCLIYQCSEGEVPERALFKQLKEKVREMEHWFITNLPSYDAAEWDAEKPATTPIT